MTKTAESVIVFTRTPLSVAELRGPRPLRQHTAASFAGYPGFEVARGRAKALVSRQRRVGLSRFRQ
jgi:hypothetical protein